MIFTNTLLWWHQYQFSRKTFFYEIILCRGNFGQRITIADKGTDSTVFNMNDQLIENCILLVSAAMKCEVLQVKCSQIQLYDWASDSTRNSVATTPFEHLQECGPIVSPHQIQHHGDAIFTQRLH